MEITDNVHVIWHLCGNKHAEQLRRDCPDGVTCYGPNVHQNISEVQYNRQHRLLDDQMHASLCVAELSH